MAALVNNTEYCLIFRFLGDGGGEGTPTDSECVTPEAFALVATPVSETQINLTWLAYPGATGYDIERDSVIIVANHGTNSYSDTGLDPGVSYDYRVRAVM